MTDNEEYTMIVTVASKPGENNVSIVKISDLDLQILQPMLEDIRDHRGYYPSGINSNLSARDLYRKHQGWDVFESIIPRPLSGFSTIISISLYREEPLQMFML